MFNDDSKATSYNVDTTGHEEKKIFFPFGMPTTNKTYIAGGSKNPKSDEEPIEMG